MHIIKILEKRMHITKNGVVTAAGAHWRSFEVGRGPGVRGAGLGLQPEHPPRGLGLGPAPEGAWKGL